MKFQILSETTVQQLCKQSLSKHFCTFNTDLLNPETEMAPLFPVQDKFSHWMRVQRDCRYSRDVSLILAQYGCKLRWMYCRGSQQCWYSSLQVCASLHRSGTVRWLKINWMSYIKNRKKKSQMVIQRFKC